MGTFTNLHGRKWAARVDATDSILIGPLKPSDFDAKAKNPMECVLAKACKRHKKVNGGWTIKEVWIGATVADVHFKEDPDVLYRYFLSQEDVKRVNTFDRHPELVREIGTWSKDITVRLVPPPASLKLGSHKQGRSGPPRKRNGKKTPSMRHLFTEA